MNPLRSAGFLLGLAALTLSTACGGGEDRPIYLGVAGPVSAANGVSMKQAAEMAVAQINARRRAAGERPLALVVLDDSASPERAMRVAGELRAADSVVAVIGHVNSSASLKAAGIYNAPRGTDSLPGTPVLQISPASSSPQLTHAGRWTFRVTPTDLEFSPRLAEWAVRELGARRAAVLYVNDDYGQGVRATFDSAFVALGGTVISSDPYLPGTLARGTELDPYLVRALRRGADALVIGGQADAGLQIVRAARRLGFSGPILGSDGMTGVKDGGAVAEGVYVSSAFLPDRDHPKAREFVAAYRERYGSLPDHRGAMAYDVVHLLDGALRRVGPDRRALRDHVAGIRSAENGLDGVSGRIVFDENGDVVGKEVAVAVVRGGELVTVRRR